MRSRILAYWALRQSLTLLNMRMQKLSDSVTLHCSPDRQWHCTALLSSQVARLLINYKLQENVNYKENNSVNAFFLIVWAGFLWMNTVLMQAVDSNVASEPSIEDLSAHTAHSAQATNDAT